MIQHVLPAAQIVVGLAGGLLAGFVTGLAHFGTLAANLRLLTRHAAWRALALQIVRILLTALVFVALARLGPWVFVGAGAGFLAARAAALARARSAS